MKGVQETYAPQNRCFGCGPANDKGLRIRSFEEGEELVCAACGRRYPIRNDIPVMLIEEGDKGRDAAKARAGG